MFYVFHINKHISLFTYSLRNLLRLFRKSLCFTIHHTISPCSQVKRGKWTKIYNIERWNFTSVEFKAPFLSCYLKVYSLCCNNDNNSSVVVTWLNVLNTCNPIASDWIHLEFGMMSQQGKQTFKIHRMGKPYDGFKLTFSEE